MYEFSLKAAGPDSRGGGGGGGVLGVTGHPTAQLYTNVRFHSGLEDREA